MDSCVVDVCVLSQGKAVPAVDGLDLDQHLADAERDQLREKLVQLLAALQRRAGLSLSLLEEFLLVSRQFILDPGERPRVDKGLVDSVRRPVVVEIRVGDRGSDPIEQDMRLTHGSRDVVDPQVVADLLHRRIEERAREWVDPVSDHLADHLGDEVILPVLKLLQEHEL